ncbi:MAG: formate dehydrogenase accessory protein FdhE [Deltaproteobacteria bacterium]|nr:formate dehydrogenase accessory protein FdhE [Deltaproteobacteria bacterium]MDA8304957.1 formate dehydrogenase accessory protein FdhE [Deltaproteobacteria bacterium]
MTGSMNSFEQVMKNIDLKLSNLNKRKGVGATLEGVPDIYKNILISQKNLVSKILKENIKDIYSLPAGEKTFDRPFIGNLSINAGSVANLFGLFIQNTPFYNISSGLNNNIEKYVRNVFNDNYDYLTRLKPDEIVLFEGFLRPFLESMAIYLRSKFEQGDSDNMDNFSNTCSFCGSEPSYGFLKSDDETQNYLMLECSKCGSAWRYYRVQCVFCGEEDPSKLEIFKSDEYGNAGLQYCKTCKNYFKIIDLRNDQTLIPEIEDILTIPFDIWMHKNMPLEISANAVL